MTDNSTLDAVIGPCAADVVALEAGLAYVGLVASRRRGAAVADELRAAGVALERVAALDTPAGLDLGARTPGEIALSILARIVGVSPARRPAAPARARSGSPRPPAPGAVAQRGRGRPPAPHPSGLTAASTPLSRFDFGLLRALDHARAWQAK